MATGPLRVPSRSVAEEGQQDLVELPRLRLVEPMRSTLDHWRAEAIWPSAPKLRAPSPHRRQVDPRSSAYEREPA